jgi:hypothetical protein
LITTTTPGSRRLCGLFPSLISKVAGWPFVEKMFSSPDMVRSMHSSSPSHITQLYTLIMSWQTTSLTLVFVHWPILSMIIRSNLTAIMKKLWPN